MGRPKRGKKIKKPDSDEDIINNDGPDPESDEFFHDAVDKFNLNREKILLDTEGDESEGEDSMEEEEVMGLNLPDSDDEDDEEDDDGDDIDDDESDEEAKLPNDKSWGKKKSAYYNADANEQDIGSDEEAWELEKEEEAEALALQQRLAAGLDEEDFDTANYEIPKEEDTEDKSVEDEEIDKTVVMDLTKLSKEQKLEILFRDSPELFELLDQFKEKLQELTSQISPLMQLLKFANLPTEGSKYIELKYQLYLNYCINIGFYLLLKSKQTPVKDHPVIERIVQYRNLIKELEPVDKKLETDMQFLLENKEKLLELSENTSETKTKSRKPVKDTKAKLKKKAKKPTTKLSALLDDSDEDETEEQEIEPPLKKAKKSKMTSEDSIDPVEYYEKVRLEKKKAKEIKDLAARLAHEPQLELDDLDINEEGKRAITYQISKNKGLTVKKKKEDRNPRVKHRKKYSKAIIKRKSQVRPVTNEMSRYDGEKSGIRAFLTRSIKIK